MHLNINVSTKPIITVGPLEWADRDSAWASIASALHQHDETLMTSARPDGILILDA
jgi:hypothetical protein